MEDVAKLLSWHSPAPVFAHLQDYVAKGTPDSVWIPQMAEEKWIILTADRGKHGRIKLPAICTAYQITHILMGPSLLHRKQLEKARAIVAIWEDIAKCSSAPSGSRFRFTISSSGRPNIALVAPATI